MAEESTTKTYTEEEMQAIVARKLGDGATEKQIRLVSDAVMKQAQAETKAAQLEAELKAAKAAAPAEDAVVLTGDEAKHYNDLKTKGGDTFSLKGLGDALKAGTDAAAKLAAHDRQALLASVPGLNAKAFGLLEGFKDLPLEAEGEGDERKVYAVVDGKKTPLLDHVGAQDAEIKGLLLSGATPPATGTQAASSTSKGGTYVQQRTAGGAATGANSDDLVGAFLQKQQNAINPQPPAKA